MEKKCPNSAQLVGNKEQPDAIMIVLTWKSGLCVFYFNKRGTCVICALLWRWRLNYNIILLLNLGHIEGNF